MTTITDQLAEALRILTGQVKPYEDGDGAAMYHAQNIAREALTAYDAQRAEARPVITDEQLTTPIRVLVHLDGGIVQGTLANREGVEVIVVDYDIDGADDADLYDVPQDDGSTEPAFVGNWSATVDGKFIDGVISSMLGA